MSPISQYAAVATLTFAVLGFQAVAFALLALTLTLLMIGFITPGTFGRRQGPAMSEDIQDPPPPAPTPNETAATGDRR